MESFDLVVIGGGPGGYLCAERAAQAGFKVALCESRALGGTCLNEGCIPTKSLLYCGKQYSNALHGADYGVTVQNVSYDHGFAVDRKNAVVNTLVSGVGAVMAANGVTIYSSPAKILKKNEHGYTVLVNDVELSGERLVIATGSVASVPPVPGVNEGLASGFVMTNREILDCKEVPETLVCIGGGVIGLEMACYYATIGKKVYVIEMMPKIAGPTDSDICSVLMKNYKKKGMVFCLGAKVEAVGTNSVTYSDEIGTHTVECDKVLLAAGRHANCTDIGLETLGVEVQRGAIVVDERLLTNVPNVYAVGDCNGKLMLAHTAYREAEVAVNNMLGKADFIDYDCVPSVIYTNPEVACVGKTEQRAVEMGMNVKAVKVPMMMSGRYVAENKRGDGFCKLVYDVDSDCLVGVHMIGSYVSEIIYGAAMMIKNKTPIAELKSVVFPHPTISEVIREALFML